MSRSSKVFASPEKVDSSSMAIIYPLFNSFSVKVVLVLASVLVAAMVFSLPQSAELCKTMCWPLSTIYVVAVEVPEIRNMAATSAFPLTLAVSYFSAMAMGVFGALIVLFTRLKTMNLSVFGYGNWKSVLMRWGVYVLWGSQFIHASPSGSPYGRIHLVTAAIKSNHWALLWFSVSIYVVSLGVTTALFCELKNLLTREKE